MTNVNSSIRIELTAVSADLVFLVLSLEYFIVRKYHSVDAVADVGALAELAKPFGSFFVDNLLELKVITIEIEWFLNVVQEVLD